jgi:hypothetical protein
MVARKKKPDLDNIDALDDATRQHLYQLALAERAREKSRALEARGWRHWYATMFDEPIP